MKFRVFLLIIVFVLSSCSHGAIDGPPRYFSPKHIENIKPQNEPLSKYGNMASYSVFGKTYYPQKKVAKNTVEYGEASWYGTKFHGNRTSSGEPYDLNKLTAAHKTLPLPSYVKVTNLENNKSLIVKVNDRGPFKKGRILDLSYAAAYKLDMLKKGTAKIKLQVLN